MSEDISIAVSVIAVVLGGVALAFLIGLTTHESHVKEIQFAHTEMLACIQSDRPAADCRLIVYGSR